VLTIDIITIFPGMFTPVISASIIKRARDKKKVKIRVHDLRDYTKDKHRKVDDRPFGGGPGMVMMPQPIFDAVKKIKGRRRARVILMCAGGRCLDNRKIKALAKRQNLIIICGHYEGVDERIMKIVDERISIGDYVLTGGELPALVVTDGVIRHIPGVLGKAESLEDESFEHGLLEYPHYTRPAKFKGMPVPKVLLSGNHKDITAWRRQQSLARTRKVRPDLL